MEFITYQQYIEYLKKNQSIKLREKETFYQTSSLKEKEIFNKRKIKEITKKHDKMFRNILNRKKEMANFLNQFLNLKEKIQDNQIIQCYTDFITKQYENKQSDIIYKLKNKPVYFLVEHQSTIDQEMPLRIWKNVGEIMRKESILQKTYLRKDKIYPVIVPVVIYTGFQKWKVATTNFADKQYQSSIYREYLGYNLIAIHNYTFEELLEKKTLLGYVMIIEKCRETKELKAQLNKIIEVMNEPKDLEAMAEIITNIMIFRIGQEKAKELLEEIKRKGKMSRSPLTKMLLDLEYKGWKKGMREGEAKGKGKRNDENRKKYVAVRRK